MSPLISVENLGKKYKRFANHWSRLMEFVSGSTYCGHEEKWALRHVSFQVNPGESVGIVGQNGSGKSTLLKLLTGTTLPSEGDFHLEGRISAMLELGLGFHGEFTGRENATMACRMMGLEKEQTDSILPEIIQFSELGDYIDQPLRVYSTGMQMRLAFSAATAVRPETLIIDEALAVGDVYFQHKCMRRIRTYNERGTTLLFVSHDPGAIKSLCDRAILLDKGSMIIDDAPDTVLDYYNGMIAKKDMNEEIQQVETDFGKTATRSGTGQAEILDVDMLDETGRSARAFNVNDIGRIRCRIRFKDEINEPTVGFLIRDRLGNDIYGTNTHYLDVERYKYCTDDQVEITFRLKLQLGSGNYSVCMAVHTGYAHIENNYDWWDQCLAFQILPNETVPFIGCAALHVEIERIHKE